MKCFTIFLRIFFLCTKLNITYMLRMPLHKVFAYNHKNLHLLKMFCHNHNIWGFLVWQPYCSGFLERNWRWWSASFFLQCQWLLWGLVALQYNWGCRWNLDKLGTWRDSSRQKSLCLTLRFSIVFCKNLWNWHLNLSWIVRAKMWMAFFGWIWSTEVS